MTNQQTNQSEAQETLEILHQLSELLNCDIDRQTLSIIVSLIENGVNPVAVASIIKEIKSEHQNNS